MEVFNSAVDSYIAGRVYRLPVCGGCLSGCCRCVWLLVACLPVCLQSVCMTNQYASAVCGCSCCSGCLFSTLASLASNRRSLHRLTPPASSLPAVFVSAAGVDRRSMLEIECAAKIGLSGGPLYYRCVLYCCVHVLHCSWQSGCTAWGVHSWLVMEWLGRGRIYSTFKRCNATRPQARQPGFPPPFQTTFGAYCLFYVQVRHVRQPHERAHAA
jgi:hypothetical protein